MSKMLCLYLLFVVVGCKLFKFIPLTFQTTVKSHKINTRLIIILTPLFFKSTRQKVI